MNSKVFWTIGLRKGSYLALALLLTFLATLGKAFAYPATLHLDKNLYAVPSMGSVKIGTVPANAVIDIQKCIAAKDFLFQGAWCAVSTSEGDGWIFWDTAPPGRYGQYHPPVEQKKKSPFVWPWERRPAPHKTIIDPSRYRQKKRILKRTHPSRKRNTYKKGSGTIIRKRSCVQHRHRPLSPDNQKRSIPPRSVIKKPVPPSVPRPPSHQPLDKHFWCPAGKDSCYWSDV